MLRAYESFAQCRNSARAALQRGDIDSARWWGAQAREDWQHVLSWLPTGKEAS